MNEYKTSDWKTILFLLCNGAKMVGSKRVDENRVEFLFANQDACERMARQMLYDDAVSIGRVLHEIGRARAVIRETK